MAGSKKLKIIINGKRLTDDQALTVHMALLSFDKYLIVSLGPSEHLDGGYLKRVDHHRKLLTEIQKIAEVK